MLWLLLRRGAGVGTTIVVVLIMLARCGNAVSKYQPEADRYAAYVTTPNPTAQALLTKAANLSATLNASPVPTTTKTPRPTTTPTPLPTPSALPTPTPTFVSVEELILTAQAATPLPTPVKPITERTYPNVIWRLLERYSAQYSNWAAAASDAVAGGMMYPAEFNDRLSDVAYQAEQVHALANEIRSLHAPDNFRRYHERVLAALEVLEYRALAAALWTDDPAAFTNEEWEQIKAASDEALDTLSSFPRTGK